MVKENVMKLNRLKDLEEYLSIHSCASNEDLCQHFKISLQTLRRDLKELEKTKLITKVYGGVVYNTPQVNQRFILDLADRFQLNSDAKDQVAYLASLQVEDYDTIFIDSGTTACRMLPFLKERKKIIVVSHSLNVFNEASKYENIELIAIGGKFNPKCNSFQNDSSAFTFYYNKAFIATVGLSLNRGLSNTDFNEGQIKQTVMKASDTVYLLCDHSKLDVIAFNHFADLTQVNTLIIDHLDDERYRQYCKKMHINIISSNSQ